MPGSLPRFGAALAVLVLVLTHPDAVRTNAEHPDASPVVLTLRQQAAVYNARLKDRLDRVLPELMRQEGLDMWLVVCRENNEDPVYPHWISPTSMRRNRPDASTAGAAEASPGMASERAMSDPLPASRIPSTGAIPPAASSPFATSLTVPSPPSATTRSAPSTEDRAGAPFGPDVNRVDCVYETYKSCA